MDYKRLYICPIFDKCTNHACFMHGPHTRGDYYHKLGNIAFGRCIEKFNEAFECGGQKLKLDEIKFTR